MKTNETKYRVKRLDGSEVLMSASDFSEQRQVKSMTIRIEVHPAGVSGKLWAADVFIGDKRHAGPATQSKTRAIFGAADAIKSAARMWEQETPAVSE